MPAEHLETFAKITLTCETERWKGIPITLRTGKKLPKKYGQIKITFKQATQHVQEAYPALVPNALLIDIHPFQDINLLVNTRKPHTNNHTIVPITLAFSQKSAFGPNTSDEYAVLLAEVCKGDKTLFTRFDEVRASWKIIEQIETIKSKIPFVMYPDGTDPELVPVTQESPTKTKTF
jgi:glucose-6-phosphate 1-dehydrogenase